MSEEKNCQPDTKSRIREIHKSGHQNAFYFFGFVGAAVYYISAATTFWTGVLGFLKAIVWPAFLVYEALKYLAM